MSHATSEKTTPYKSPSIREIARRAGVSASTVSRVLNKRDTTVPIAEGTKQKVLDASRRLRYQPNIHALRLFGGRSDSVAVMVPPRGEVLPGVASYTDSNLAKTLAGMLDAATEHGQHLVIVASDRRVIEKGGHLDLFRGRSIDGMLIWGAVEQSQAHIRQIVDEGWPVVLVNSHVADKTVPHVLVDNRAGGAALAEHLLTLGHRRIAFLAGPTTASVAVDRREGFEEVCRQAGVEPTVLSGEFRFESGQELAAQLLASSKPPTAIAAVDDVMAMGVVEAAQSLGLRVPEDLSVTGADDAFTYFKPRLTTFAAPMETLGRQGLQLLLKMQEDAHAWPTARMTGKNIISGQLIVGRTTAPPRGERSR